MHLVDGSDMLLDPEGSEMHCVDVPSKAMLAARDCMANDVKDGRLNLGYRIEVHDDSGRMIHRLEFGDALHMVGRPADLSAHSN
jgi:hypothetical protein